MEKPTIKHLVVSGGGAYGLVSYGALKESSKQGFWNISNIQSIYATSIGAVFTNIIALSPDWETTDNYIINRPWNQVFVFDMYSIMNSFSNKGIMNIKVVEDVFTPLLKARDLSPNINLKEYYDSIGIEFHLFTTCLEDLTPVDISYKTHPEWKLTEAIYASCCLPVLFSPLVKEGKTYFDGGVFCNYPLFECCETVENKDEIFGVYTKINNTEDDNKMESIFDYLMVIITKLMDKLETIVKPNKDVFVENQVIIEKKDNLNLYSIYLAANDNKERIALIERGKQEWEKFLEKKNEDVTNS